MRSKLPWILFLVSAAATYAILLWRPWAADTTPPGPAVRPRTQLDNMPVYYGRSGDVEMMLRPFMADAETGEYDRRQWTALLGEDERPRAFALFIVVNHGAEPIPWPFAGGRRLRLGRTRDVLTPLDELISPAHPERAGVLKPFFALWAQAGRETVVPREIVTSMVAIPLDLGFDSSAELELDGEPALRFEMRRLLLADLWRWEDGRRGRLADLVQGRAENRVLDGGDDLEGSIPTAPDTQAIKR